MKEYLIDLDATNAAKRAGYKDANKGRQLVTLSNVKAAIDKGKEKQAVKLDLKAERVLLEYARIGFADPRRLFAADGTMKPVAEWPDDLAACIASVETFEEFEGTGKSKRFVGYVRKVRFWPKVEALRDIGKHIGIFPDRPSATVNVNVENLSDAERIERIRQLIERARGGRLATLDPGTAEGTRPLALSAESGDRDSAERPGDGPADGDGGTGPVAEAGSDFDGGSNDAPLFATER